MWVGRTQKCNRQLCAINALGVTARQIHPVSCTVYRAENGNLGSLEPVENNGTAFAPKQCLSQKVAVGKENSKTQSTSRCNKRTGRYSPANTPGFMHGVQCREWKFGKFRSCRKQWYRLCIQAMFGSKGSCGYGEPKNAIANTVQ